MGQQITPQIKNTTVNADETEGSWWGYYIGDFASGSMKTLGMGSNFDLPFPYNCAVKLPVKNDELRNKVVKAIRFAFVHTDFIDDVSVWISRSLPDKPQDADICYLPVDMKDIKSLSADNVADGKGDAVTTERNNEGLGVSISGNESYRGFQMDVVVPNGGKITSVIADNSISATHNVMFSKLSDGRYRIIAHSLNGCCMTGNGDKLIDICADNDDVRIENIIFVTSDLQEKRFNSVEGNTAGIDDINIDAGNGDIFDISGVRTLNPAKGIYILLTVKK